MSSIEAEEAIVDSLAIMMKGKLRANGHKPSWIGADPCDFIDFLKAEVEELQEAIVNGKPADIKLECADVANMAAMIAHVAGPDTEDFGDY